MKVKICETDKSCCDKGCDYKREGYCVQYGAELFGDKDNPTRCADCYLHN